jgi:hypothetical protein
MKEPVLILITFITICCSSCKQNKQKNDARRIVAEWTGKKIRFPDGLPCTSMGKDTACIDLHNDHYKIFLYVDSLGCTSCRLKLAEWKKLMADADSIFEKRIEFIFFFQPKKKDEKELQYIFKQNGFRHPVFIDKQNEINKLNNFPSQTEYQCFLLDKDNKVLIVGNPSYNPGIWTLYKKVITERET